MSDSTKDMARAAFITTTQITGWLALLATVVLSGMATVSDGPLAGLGTLVSCASLTLAALLHVAHKSPKWLD